MPKSSGHLNSQLTLLRHVSTIVNTLNVQWPCNSSSTNTASLSPSGPYSSPCLSGQARPTPSPDFDWHITLSSTHSNRYGRDCSSNEVTVNSCKGRESPTYIGNTTRNTRDRNITHQHLQRWVSTKYWISQLVECIFIFIRRCMHNQCFFEHRCIKKRTPWGCWSTSSLNRSKPTCVLTSPREWPIVQHAPWILMCSPRKCIKQHSKNPGLRSWQMPNGAPQRAPR